MTTPNLDLDELTANQSQPEVPINRALRALDAVVQLSVLGFTSSLPGSPSDGDRYILSANAGSGLTHDVAYYSGGWRFATPEPGWTAYVQNLATNYQFGLGSPQGWQLLTVSGSIQVIGAGSPSAVFAGVTQVEFSGQTVTDVGGGRVQVAAAGSSSLQVRGTGSPGMTVNPCTQINFDGLVEVVDAGGGIAVVTVFGDGNSGGGGGGGAPGGATGEMQYNNAGALAGTPNVVIGIDGSPAINTATGDLAIEISGEELYFHRSPHDQSYQYENGLSSGNTVSIGVDADQLLLGDTGTLATLTIELPATPSEGRRVGIGGRLTVTVVTISGVGETVYNAPTGLVPTAPIRFQFRAGDGWYRI